MYSPPGSTQTLSSTQNIQLPHTSLDSAYKPWIPHRGPGFYTQALGATQRPWVLLTGPGFCPCVFPFAVIKH